MGPLAHQGHHHREGRQPGRLNGIEKAPGPCGPIQRRKTIYRRRPAGPLRGADVGILICGDLERAFPRAQEYWAIDGAIAGQNMTLAAKALGIGSVRLGT